MISLCLTSKAQRHTLQGQLQDSASKTKIVNATVGLYNKPDTAILQYQLSDEEGRFHFRNVSSNNSLLVIITSVGYKPYFITLNPVRQNIDLGKISLKIIVDSLKEVIVYPPQPVEIRDGMIIYNTSFFKLPKDALLENLLKRLPGFEFDKNGNLFVGGKKINRITIDYKPYFNDNINIAIKNLPADIIEAVEVSADTNESRQNPLVMESNMGSTINIRIKKEAKNNWIGKAYAGAGTQERYDVGAAFNRFKDTTQISLLGFSNNVNKTNASLKDMLYASAPGINNNQLLRPNQAEMNQEHTKLTDFFNDNSGVFESTEAGINFNIGATRNNYFSIQYLFKRKEPFINNHVLSSQFLGDTIIERETRFQKRAEAYSHNIVVDIERRKNFLLSTNLKVNLSLLTGEDSSFSNTRISDNKSGPLSTGIGVNRDKAIYGSIVQSFTLTKRFSQIPQRKFTLLQNFELRNGSMKTFADFTSLYIFPYEDTFNTIQRRRSDIPYFSGTVNATYNEPLFKTVTLGISSTALFSRDEQKIETRDNSGSIKGSLSGKFSRDYFRSRNSLFLQYNSRKTYITGGAHLQYQHIKYNTTIAKPGGDNITNLLPYLTINWNQNNFGYSTEVVIPPAGYLVPVPDSTNSLFIINGNPNLKPSYQYRLNANFFKLNSKKWVTYTASLSARLVNNDIILSRGVNDRGVQVTKPENANGTISIYSTLGFSKEFKQSANFSYFVRLRQSTGFTKKRFIINGNTGKLSNVTITPFVSTGIYSHQVFEISADYQLNLNNVRYDLPGIDNNSFADHQLNIEFALYKLKRITLRSNFIYFRLANNTVNTNSETALLNASLSYSLFKNKAQIGMSVFDILQKNRGLARYVNDSFISQVNNNVLEQYGLITFTYNFRKK